ncbi:class I SAM-dependent methyltransferase [Actinomadura rudentiformis]|uniref:Class I SAM-dependent methyltransferase n=1 Tax=Actinomadura rudentiformis TaxID=359158 RepID=A0A6H9YUZ4_9ACTN|nr:class I SAM-dependent methyltransferase [Actinomadura rudentiformis]KAB2343709.1 class I SAM-dependent methyltransferase [Actinomadura rudentiformis]
MTTEELTERLLEDSVTAMEMLSVALGIRLGLYKALAGEAADARALAKATGVHPRYAREWLEQQGASGLLTVAADDEDPYARVFSLPADVAEALLNGDSPFFVGPLPGFVASIAEVLPQVADAFGSGGGVPYAAYGEDTRHGIGALNRPAFRAGVADWIAGMPDIAARLDGDGARVLDLGCGTGWSSIALAEAFPAVSVHGIDLDEASIAEASGHAAEQGLADRVTFALGDAAKPGVGGRYDLVCVFEALHDMADPVAALRSARDLLTPGGAVLIGDEKVAEHFTAPGDLLERMNYAFSVLHCLPATRAEGAAVEAGTVLRPGTVRSYADQSGYAGCAELPIDHDLWRFYRLDPA